MMNLKLTVIAAPPDSSLTGQSFTVGATGATLGRGAANTCVLPDSERIVSSKHAAIRYELGQFVVTDTSTNGTYLNNSPTPLGPSNAAPLNEGDSLRIGHYEFSVAVESQAAPAPAAPAAGAGSFLDELSPKAGASAPVVPAPSDGGDDFDKWLEPQQQPSKQPDPLWGAANVVQAPLASIESEENDPLAAIEQAQNAANPLDLPPQDDDPDWWKSDQNDQVAPVNQAYVAPKVAEPTPAPAPFAPEPTPVPDPVPSPASSPAPSSDHLDPLKALDQQQPAAPNFSEPAAVREDTNPSGFAVSAEADVDDAGDLDALLGLPSGSDSLSASSVPAQPAPESFSDPAATGVVPSFEATEPPPHPEVPAAPVAEPRAELRSELRAEPAVQAPSQSAPPAQPVQNPAAAADTAQLLSDLLELGNLDAAQLQNLAPEVAGVVRETVARLLEMLRVRSSIKNELRLDRTMIQPVENNPLKFSLTEKDALRYLFGEQSGAYMSGNRAVREAFADIEDHQVALLAGMRSAYERMLAKFSPDVLEKKIGDQAAKGLLSSKKSRLWDAYEEYFDTLRRDPETSYNRLFGDDFASAYEEQIDNLKGSRRDSD